MPFGVTDDGFSRKTFQDIKTEFETKQRARIDANLDLSDETIEGQQNGIVGAAMAEAWETLEGVYHSFNPNAAEGDAMVNIALLTGTPKRGATPSSVICVINLDPGATCPQGFLVSLDTRPDVHFELTADVTDPGPGGNNNGLFHSVEDGPVVALAGHLTSIVTVTSGVHSVTNPLDASLGRLADDTITLRQRRQQQLALRGGSTVDAIHADLLQIQNVTTVEMLENETDFFDPITGLSANTFEAIVYDSGLVPNNTIAQTIFDSKPAGIFPFGNTSGVAVDGEGKRHIVPFSRPIEKLIYIKITVTVSGLFPPLDGEQKVKEAILAKAADTFGGGDDVTALVLQFGALGALGVTNAPVITIGLAANPTLHIDIPIGLHEIAKFDSSRIDLTIL